MNTFCHFGNPKALSTSLQGTLQELESKGVIKYLGFRANESVNDWYEDPYLSEILNFDLRFTSQYNWDLKKESIKEYFSKIRYETHKDLWISSENLSTKFNLEDIDTFQKLTRLNFILPQNTTYILIFRNIFESLVSIHKEYIKHGYTKNFIDFTKETFLFREANFLQSLLPGHLVHQFIKVNKKVNLKIHFLSQNSSRRGQSLAKFISSLNPHYGKIELKMLNSSNNRGPSEKILEFNQNKKSNLDGTGLLETHRAFWHLPKDHLLKDLTWLKLRSQKKARVQANHQGKNSSMDSTNILSKNLSDYLRTIKEVDENLFLEYSDNLNEYNRMWDNLF